MSKPGTVRRHTGLIAGLLGVIGAHVALTFYFAPPGVLLGPDPLLHDAHGVTVQRLSGSGAASQPGGLLGLTAMALAGTGHAPARIYGALLFGLHLIVPALGMAAARAARASVPAMLVAGGLFSALWWFDSLTHWCWYAGRVGWLVAALAMPFVLAQAARVARGGSRLALLGALAALGVSLAPLGEPTRVVFSSRASLLVFDFLDVLSDGYGAEGNVRTAFRTLVWASGAIVLFERGRRDASTRVFGAFMVASLGFAYFGGHLPVAWPVEPYLLLVPATFAAALPAAELLARALSPAVVWSLDARSRALLGLALVAAAPWMARAVLSYIPEWMPARVLRSPADLRVSALVGPNERTPDPLRHASPPK